MLLFPNRGFPHSSVGKKSAYNAGDPSSIPGSGRPPEEGRGYPLKESCLENSMDRGAWQAEVRGVAKSQTQVSGFHFIFTLHRDQLCSQAWRRFKDAACGTGVLCSGDPCGTRLGGGSDPSFVRPSPSDRGVWLYPFGFHFSDVYVNRCSQVNLRGPCR